MTITTMTSREPFEQTHTTSESPITALSRVIGGRCASGGIKTAADAEGAIELGADLVAIGRCGG